jgi:hypothetical protein
MIIQYYCTGIITGIINHGLKPDFSWEYHDGAVIPVYNHDLVSQDHLAFKALIDITNKYNMSQMVHQPTTYKNTLDLMFTNDPQSILDITVSSVPSNISDHCFINITTTYRLTPHPTPPPPTPPPLFATFDYPSSDTKKLEPELKKIDWDFVLTPNMSVAEMYNAMTDATTEASLRGDVPRRNPGQVPSGKPKHIKKLWRKKCTLLRKLASNPNLKDDLQPKINAIDTNIQLYFAEKDDNAETKAVSSLKDDPTAFYAYVKAKRTD